MADRTDMHLLQEYAESASEAAFADLVHRHIHLVYSVALRYVGHVADAQDVTQAVFVILAQKASGLRHRATLTGWLYETTRFTAAHLVRTRARQQTREQEAYMQSTLNDADTDEAWRLLAPVLEEAMSRLNEKERALLALCYFENKTAAESAALLGMGADAAHKRGARALEKLRRFFLTRGVLSTTTVIAGALSAHSIQAAPSALTETVVAVAVTKGTAAGASTLILVKGAVKAMAWAKAKITTLIGLSVLLAAGTATVAVKEQNVRVSAEWKAHFKANLVIENCVFERSTFSFGTETNLYQVRFQKGAFVIRQLSKLADADLDHIAGGTVYAGGVGSNYWAIEAGQVLKLFPDADKMIREYQNTDVSLIDGSRSILMAALYYGFPSLDPATVEWLDESTFAASGTRGGRLHGKILEAVGGLPTKLEWHSDADPDFQIIVEFKYSQKLDLAYYPSEISVGGQSKGRTVLSAVYRILSLKTSPEPLPATWFDSARYFGATNFSAASNSARVLKVTENGLYYSNAHGTYEKVLRQSPDDGTLGSRANPNVSRALILGLAVLSVMGLYFVWKFAKQQKRKD